MSVILLAMLVAQAPDSAAANPPKEPLVCRDSSQTTGSHMRTGRRCMTQEKWDAEDARLANRSADMRITGHQRDALDPTTRPQ